MASKAIRGKISRIDIELIEGIWETKKRNGSSSYREASRELIKEHKALIEMKKEITKASKKTFERVKI